MKNISVLSLAAMLAMAGILFHADARMKVSNFTLEDYNGTKHSLTDYSSSKAIVLMFIATKCPVSNAYNDRMVQISKAYSSKGVAFVGINANKEESIEEIKNHSQEHGFPFPVLKDWNNKIADQLQASVTPEIFVLDNDLNVLYHGRIDDSRRASEVKTKDLQNALDAVLAGKTIAMNETKAFGCSIKRVK
jgi:peroxiredoxin